MPLLHKDISKNNGNIIHGLHTKPIEACHIAYGKDVVLWLQLKFKPPMVEQCAVPRARGEGNRWILSYLRWSHLKALVIENIGS